MTSEDRVTSIGELKPGMRNVSCVFIVIDRGSTSHTKDGSLVRKCRVADRSGSILFSVWNEEADAIEASDIVRLSRGYASVWKGDLVLYCGKYGLVEKLGEFTMVYSDVPDMSVWEPPANDQQSSSSSQQQHGPSTPTAHSPHSQQSRPHSLSRIGGAPTARNGTNHHHHHPSTTPVGHPPPLLEASWSNEDSPSTLHNHISHNDHPSHRHNHHHSSHTKSAHHRHAPSSNGHTRYHPYPSSHQSITKEHWR